MRIFNTASTDTGAVDIYLIGSACSALAGSTSAAVTTGVTGLQASYTEVAATGSAHLCVTSTGDKTDLRLEIASFTLADQQITTLILARSPGGVLLQGLLLDQQGALTKALNTSARVRVAASLQSPGNVAATVNGTVVTAGLASPAVGPYNLVPAGALTVSVNSVVVPVTAASLPPGADLTLLVTGTATAPAAFAITDDNTVSTSSVRPVKLRLVNGLNGVAGVATLSVNNTPLGSGAAFGAASSIGTFPASAAATRLDVTIGGVTTNLGTTVTLGAGSVYTEFLLGSVATIPPVTQLIADR